MRDRSRCATASFNASRVHGGVRSISCSPYEHAQSSRDLRRQRRHQLLGDREQILVGGIRLVELEHGELGIVLGRDALVAEAAIELEDAVEAADHQPLQVELGRDAQIEIEVEGVVVRHERTRQRAAGDRLHHRGLDLEEAAGAKELARGVEDLGAGAEDLAHVGVHEQIEIALAVAHLDVGQAVPLLGQRTQRLGEVVDRRGEQRRLAGPGTEQPPLEARDVAEIELAKDREVVLADLVLLHVDLQPPALILQLGERRLAEVPDRHQAAGQARRDRRRVELGGRCRPVA